MLCRCRTADCNTEEDTEHYKFREGTYCEKLIAFFHAPVIVFSCNTVSIDCLNIVKPKQSFGAMHMT